tara:strand:+ start:5735 stop:6085 length:351 start_codon:yes stop_codon:yes gene_type:complete
MYKLNSIFSSRKITIVVILLTTITILGCGDSSTDTTSDKSENDINYENKDLSLKSNIEEVGTSKNNTKESEPISNPKGFINTEPEVSLNSDNYSKALEIKDVDTGNLSLIFLYSDY